jgi:putative transposase
MAVGRPLAPLALSKSEREELVSITRSRSMPQSPAIRARIVLLAADGESNTDIAERLGLSKPTVGIWRKRYLTQRLVGLYDEPRPGGPRSIRDEQIAALLRKTLKTKPKDGTHWTCRSIAAETKLSKSTIQRVWNGFVFQFHRQKHFKISTDPFFAEKVRDIVALYLNPPDHAVVLCVDEKSQIRWNTRHARSDGRRSLRLRTRCGNRADHSDDHQRLRCQSALVQRS